MQWDADFYNFVNIQINNSQIVIINVNYKCNKIENVIANNTAATATTTTTAPDLITNPKITTQAAVEIIIVTSSANTVKNVEKNTNAAIIINLNKINNNSLKSSHQLQQQNGFQLPNHHQHQLQSNQQHSYFEKSVKFYQFNDNIFINNYYSMHYLNYFHQQNENLKNNLYIILQNKYLTIMQLVLQRYILENLLICLLARGALERCFVL